ncbi:MAG: leucine-rich repeat domain-containing protein, partial [Bacteroidales bacterium]|nr:leucine-rich repeat domain-containing protein [Bacteroidales bacterium]
MRKIVALAFAVLLSAGSLSAQTIIDSVLYINEGTTQIGSQAYYGKTTFKKVVIPSSVTKIGSLAFHSCTKLEEIDIPASVTTIGNAAFQNDSALTKVTLHEGLTNLSYSLFNSTAIKEITIPSTVTEFGDELFANCNNLSTIMVTKYSEAHAFYNTDPRMKLTDNEPTQTKEQWIASSKYNIIDEG